MKTAPLPPLVLVFILIFSLADGLTQAAPSLMPEPAEMTLLSDAAFPLNAETRIVVADADANLRGVADQLTGWIAAATGYRLEAATNPGRGNFILLRIALPSAGGVPANPEGYALTCRPAGVVIEGSTPRGVFYGAQTLRQMLPAARDPGAGAECAVPAVSVHDWPRFGWRGFMLDTGRHFFPTTEIKKLLDAMALQKMNVFHWHLTEDQGWRLQIRKYPRLTEVGAWRAESPLPGDNKHGDGVRYGGFYTQDEVKDVVAYAAARFITIVPEIEMPGHSSAAIASYPELGNSDIPDYHPQVQTRWGVHYYTYAPKEETFAFLENVLTEVMELFPGTYLHIGGDEAPKDQWKQSAFAQAFIKEHQLKDEEGLQSYFIRRIEKFINAHGRRLVGWDEIQEGGLSPTATMMVWRDRKWGLSAIAGGNDVVMTPTTNCYLDYIQADPKVHPEPEGPRRVLTLEKAYSFDPAPPDLDPAQAAHVLGTQGNLWTEHIPDNQKLEYMAFPRACALAEVAWSPQGHRSYSDFCARLPVMLQRLSAMDIGYRPPTEADWAPAPSR